MRISLNVYIYLLALFIAGAFTYLSAISVAETSNPVSAPEAPKPEKMAEPEPELKTESKTETELKKKENPDKAKSEPKPEESMPENMVESHTEEITDSKSKVANTAPMPEEKEQPLPEPDEPELTPGIKLILPTDNDEIFGDPSKFYMHTNRYIKDVNIKPWQGGAYGYVRNQRWSRIGTIYTRLHEGIDIRPVRRDSRNTPLDDVYTMADGTVAYVNSSSSRSNYGRYVVVRHDWPEGAFYSLYAHLASAAVQKGEQVTAGDVLGRLGYSGSGIDRERAHVHVELNFLLSERYGSHHGASHGNFNGMNLIGIDVARFLKQQRERSQLSMKKFLGEEEPYCKVRISTKTMPGILTRHPWLGLDMEKAPTAKSWEFTFAQTGVPLSVTPCETSYRYAIVSWVKDVNTNHSYMSMGKLLGSGSKAKLSSKGHQYIKLISEAF